MMFIGEFVLAGLRLEADGDYFSAAHAYHKALRIALYTCMMPISHPQVREIQEDRQRCFRRIRDN